MRQCKGVVERETGDETIPLVGDAKGFHIFISEPQPDSIVHLPDADFRREIQLYAVFLTLGRVSIVHNHHTGMVDVIVGYLEGTYEILGILIVRLNIKPFPIG